MDAHRRDVFAALYGVAGAVPFESARIVELDGAAVAAPVGRGHGLLRQPAAGDAHDDAGAASALEEIDRHGVEPGAQTDRRADLVHAVEAVVVHDERRAEGEARAVVGPRVVVDIERPLGARRRQPRGGHEHRALGRRRGVADDLRSRRVSLGPLDDGVGGAVR